ncbi:MFS transporter [Sphingobium algorifonticola]|uniref:MFS transporter n=1 Tax=Sphingobium algorifonticola TaxID=2008318 RepID=A0A437JC21_9SPHN|nr:MFS transporter [Sphingobium algorifonticola]RVT43458.1 MFS transporter [Sphingobium algorifonticola]
MTTPAQTMPASDGADRVPSGRKARFATGGLVAGFTLNAPNYLANPILNLTLGVNPLWIGVVIALARFWDAVTDPLFGYLSDRTSTRWGRRKPYLFVSAFLLGASFTAMWWIPRGAGETFYVIWFLVWSLIFYTAASAFLVPWQALGIELSSDYDERTRINAFVGIAHKSVGMTYAWLFPLAQLAIFQDTLTGVRYVGLGCGLLLTAACLVVAIGVPEPRQPRQIVERPRVPFMESMRFILSSPDFMRATLASVLTMMSLMTVSSLSLYINIYWVFGGDKVAAATMAGLFGIVFNTLAILAVPFVTRLSQLLGKHGAMMLCLGLIAISAILKFFAYSPQWPWGQFLIALLHAPGLSAFYVLMSSMTADLTDADELRSGQRNEALLAAANQWITKLGMSLSYIFAALILNLSGFDASLPLQHPDTVLMMRILFCAVPFTGVTLAILCLRKYSLTAAELTRVQTQLRGRASTG